MKAVFSVWLAMGGDHDRVSSPHFLFLCGPSCDARWDGTRGGTTWAGRMTKSKDMDPTPFYTYVDCHYRKTTSRCAFRGFSGTTTRDAVFTPLHFGLSLTGRRNHRYRWNTRLAPRLYWPNRPRSPPPSSFSFSAKQMEKGMGSGLGFVSDVAIPILVLMDEEHNGTHDVPIYDAMDAFSISGGSGWPRPHLMTPRWDCLKWCRTLTWTDILHDPHQNDIVDFLRQCLSSPRPRPEVDREVFFFF